MRVDGPSTSMDGRCSVAPNGASATTLWWRSPACDSSSLSTRTSLPSSGLRLPRSHHSEEWWQDSWALSGLFPLPLQPP
uniref:Alternative protein MCRS1 n=1 Tax=Homo sapiens TaxID=9606 RepID=L8E8H6_HUMAN|nr:alternative protein MCRS1 [Homo sapiens]